MEYTAKALAAVVNGKIIGDPETKVNKFARIEYADDKSITFLANPKYKDYLYKTKASIILISEHLVPEDLPKDKTYIVVKNAYQALADLLNYYKASEQTKKAKRERPVKIHRTAKIGKNVYIGAFTYIARNAQIGDNVKIYPQVYIGENVKIGDGTIIYPGVKIYHNCVIGKNCVIHAGTIIGSDGFGFAPQDDGTYKKIEQIGNVVIEDDVEIGANCAIDRATFGSTIIRKGVKLDNLIQVGHNVEIGENTVIAAQTGLAGSTKLGKNIMVGGQAGFSGHIQIGDRSKIAAKSAVHNSWPEDSTLIGIPADDAKRFSRNIAVFKNLYQFFRDFQELKLKVEKILKKLS